MSTFNFSDSDFDSVKQKAEALYETIGDVYCPYLKTNIAFNAKGLRHLKFKLDRVARTSHDQYARLKLLHLAPRVLQLSNTLQGVWETRRFESIKSNSRWDHIAVDVSYYEFIAVMDSVRVKVIVKQSHGR